MRGLHLGPGGNITSDTLFRLSSNSPGGVLFPKLESLLWNIQKTSTALTIFRLFLSPHLRYVVFCALPSLPAVPRDQLATLAQVISFLPTSLEDLIIVCGQEEGPLSDAVSSFICRCGPSLRGLCVHAPLSEAAIHHLMGLPNLRYWATVQGPPPIVPASIFPSLRDLRLEKPTALPWLHLLASHAEGVHRDVSTSVTSHSNTRETLKFLTCPWGITIDPTSLSSIVKFRNLVELQMHTHCSDVGSCVFHLTDRNMEDLTAMLPRLKTLLLGPPCLFNSCKTTVVSLMSTSIQCPDLTVLGTHFNTLTIVSDMRRLLDDGAGRDKVKCKLPSLSVGGLLLGVRGEDIGTVALGFKAIFPYLTDFLTDPGADKDGWCKLKSKLRD